MLKQLYISNYALIDRLDINFNSGFSVITGETGAGKSIILGAIGLLLGQRADSKTVKSGQQKCTIEAHFDLSRYQLGAFFKENDIDYDSEDCILRRELTATGKSRAFINDTPVQLTMMRQLGEQLVDIHSQHQNLLLQKEDFQLNVVDIIAQNSEQLTNYRKSFYTYKQKTVELEQLKANIEQGRKDEEYLRFQFNELQKAHLAAGQQELLEQESETLSHSEDIKSALFDANILLNEDEHSIIAQTKAAAQILHSIENVYPKVHELAERLDSTHIEIKDIAQEIGSDAEEIEFDPSRLDTINAQLDTIYSLQQKFHVCNITELIEIQHDIDNQLKQIDNSNEVIDSIKKEVDKLYDICKKQANLLTKIRTKAAHTVEKEMQKRLIPLGIPHVRFEVNITPTEHLSKDGHDKIQFLFSANKNTSMQPVAQVASGGEIARVMLSLKAMISGAVRLPTIIFDEIDTGVSGKIAQKMSLIMQEMGNNNRQVISITHLPQIAASGKTHYKVYKDETSDGTVSRMECLSDEQRLMEIAQMLSGDNITDAAVNNAKELLAHGTNKEVIL